MTDATDGRPEVLREAVAAEAFGIVEAPLSARERIANIGAVSTGSAAPAPAYGYAPQPTGVSLWILYRR